MHVCGGYNYFAIGNSIVLSSISDFWWSECGMAATKPEKDYFHLVSKWIKGKYENVNSMAYNFSAWEICSSDRDKELVQLDNYLSKKIDLITIQLGENVSELKIYENDYINLINYVKKKSLNAKIIIIGDFWKKGNRDMLKRQAALGCEVPYISLNKIKERSDFCCGLKTLVYGDDGKRHKVKHKGVAEHPGDKGMEYIAEKIIKKCFV